MPGTDQATHAAPAPASAPIAPSTAPDTCPRAREDLVLAHLGVARSMASRYRGRGIPDEDLQQVACAGLVAAANRFRPDLGRDFLSFAVPTIRGELRRHFRDCGWTVRPPRRVQEIQLQVLEAQARMVRSLDRSPSASEIAHEIGESPLHVSQALALDGCFTPTSLDAPVESGTATIGDLLPDAHDVERVAETRVMLRRAIRELAPRDRYVVRRRYFDDLTQQEIADELGLTQAQVSRILGRITREMRRCLAPCESSYELEMAG